MNEKFVGRVFLPGIDEMAVPARAFVAKATRDYPLAVGSELDLVFIGDFAAVYPLVATVPDREDNPALCGTIHLDAKVAPCKPTGHVVGVKRRRANRHFIVEPLGLDFFVQRVAQMHRCRVLALFKIKMRLFTGRPGEQERLRLPGSLQCEAPVAGRDGDGFFLFDKALAGTTRLEDASCGHFFDKQLALSALQIEREGPRMLELAVPDQSPIFLIGGKGRDAKCFLVHALFFTTQGLIS